MTDPVVNTKGYAYHDGEPNNRPRLNLNVSFILDMVPGAWHQPEDLMRYIANHSYVDTVTLVEDTPEPSQDGRPMVTDIFVQQAIEKIDDHYDLRDALKAWNEGEWDGALSYLTEE